MPLPPTLASARPRFLTLDVPTSPADGLREAAVLALLFPGPRGIRLLLTQRPATMNRHAGQISLPGGVRDPVDANLLATALREAREEVGLNTDHVEILGRLEPVAVTVTGYLIVPFVGWCEAPAVTEADPTEVAEVFDVALADLLDPERVHQEVWDLRGAPWRVCFYRIDGRVIWGATARVLAHLIERLTDLSRFPCIPGSASPV